MEQNFNLENEFINHYNQNPSLDFIALEKDLTQILNTESINNDIGSARIIFTEENDINMPFRLNGNHICINKTRIKVIHKLTIDCNSIFHSDWLWGFYKNEITRTTQTKEERCLTQFIDNAKNSNNLNILSHIGSIRTTEFELLEFAYLGQKMLLQENQKNAFIKSTIRNASKTDITEIFEVVYDILQEKSTDNNFMGISPANLSAKHYSITKLESYRKECHSYNTNLSLHISNTTPFSKNTTSEKVANDIWNSYEKLNTEIMKKCNNEVFAHFNTLIHHNKDIIVKNLKEKAAIIIQIANSARERLLSIADPYLIVN